MAVDYTPTLGNYTELKPFRYWCQKVLPLVYDDSLSYYELLCKVVDYLNKTMEDVEVLHGDVEDLHDAYVQLQQYVNDYLENLDVQEEINNKLDEMAADGSLSALLLPLIQNIMTPLFVSSTGSMTDTSRTYVLLPDGYMYYYDGSEWVNSGYVYGVASESFRYRGNITDNLENHTDAGFYTVSKTEVTDDLPEDYAGEVGSLIVFNPGTNNSYAFQMLKSGAADLYFRLVAVGTHTGGTWSRVVRSEEDSRFCYRGLITDDLKNHLDPGFYSINNSGSAITDLPTDFSGTRGLLTVYNPSVTTSYAVQYLRNSSDGNSARIYSRYVNNSTNVPGNWMMSANAHDLVNYIPRDSESSTGALSNKTTTGYYMGNLSNATDKPATAVGSKYTLLVFKAPTNNFVYQILIDAVLSVYKRVITSAGEVYKDWISINMFNTEYKNALSGQKWYACGDSFTQGDFTGITPAPTIGTGYYASRKPVYPYFIGNRCGMDVNVSFAVNGATLATRTDGSTGYVFADHYTEIPETAKYVTLYFGINDSVRCTLGTINDTTKATFYGALYEVITWLQTYRPNCHIGVIATNAGTLEFNQAAIAMANKLGVPCLDMNSTDHMLVLSSTNPDVSSAAKNIANAKFKVSDSNGHPNALCHELESHFIEEWLLTI
ncbi:MAG: SGNH/GDSL hydrolase family protein [Clostridiales bacterium]|nr:SGNH/GDSL hydrolase family protein [Clostridiales bacterium]